HLTHLICNGRFLFIQLGVELLCRSVRFCKRTLDVSVMVTAPPSVIYEMCRCQRFSSNDFSFPSAPLKKKPV
ncbi:MAG: hypothetical protein AAFY72_10245, partial [Cyanobacteria bacterium J06649_4]